MHAGTSHMTWVDVEASLESDAVSIGHAQLPNSVPVANN